MYMSSCEKKLNGYVNLKRTVGYQSTIIGEFACYILACLSSCLITEWLQLLHEATSSCHRVSVYCTVSCFAGSVFTSMGSTEVNFYSHLCLDLILHCTIAHLDLILYGSHYLIQWSWPGVRESATRGHHSRQHFVEGDTCWLRRVVALHDGVHGVGVHSPRDVHGVGVK